MVIAVAAVLLRGTTAVGSVEEDSRCRRLEVELFLRFGQIRLPLSHSNDVRAEVAGVEGVIGKSQTFGDASRQERVRSHTPIGHVCLIAEGQNVCLPYLEIFLE